MRQSKRIARLEVAMKQSTQNADTRAALAWVRGVTPDDVRAIDRREWAQVRNDGLRNTKHRERWEHAARVVIEGINGESLQAA
jgi:hypothetical protein